MTFPRASGVLLHPTSLPGPYGIGDIGPEAHRFIDFLSGAGCALWQILPHGPTSFGDSPYQTLSVFAGNPNLISPDLLLRDGLLTEADLNDTPNFPADRVDFGAVIPWKAAMVQKAYDHFAATGQHLRGAYDSFRAAQAHWLEEFALFAALKEEAGGRPWHEWPEAVRRRDPAALEAARLRLAAVIDRYAFAQFLFYRQWRELQAHARKCGVQIIGDIPIFVAHDSADVWANPHLFTLLEDGRPSHVAGVPPDYFSPTGQLWGNPLYRWEVHKETGYAWWMERIKATLDLVDIIRMDHFRGFDAYWEIPAGMPTAEIGQWVKGPGKEFFGAVAEKLGTLPLIAEDLGVMTASVADLRDSFGLPGMKIVQFAFDGDAHNPFLPHNFTPNYVAYTGTHDNDTSRGWYRTAPEKERDFCRRYLQVSGQNIAWDLIRATWQSVAVFAIAPLQDFLDLDTEARMNLPGTPSGNWQWRLWPGALTEDLKSRMNEMNYLYGRHQAFPTTGQPA